MNPLKYILLTAMELSIKFKRTYDKHDSYFEEIDYDSHVIPSMQNEVANILNQLFK